MTVRSGKGEIRALFIAFALIAPFVVSGCSTPKPQMSWDFETPRAKPKPKAKPVRYDNRQRCACREDVPIPDARPTPGWYERARNDSTYYPSYSTVRFQWPVQGRVIREYGTSYTGERNDGINISVPDGEPIRAAADGVVTYSGDLRAYGNLALIKHSNGYVTAYAHADRFIVDKGDRVARGQVIGYVGQTGDVTRPQLHFEIRRGARDPVDPRPLLSSDRLASSSY